MCSSNVKIYASTFVDRGRIVGHSKEYVRLSKRLSCNPNVPIACPEKYAPVGLVFKPNIPLVNKPTVAGLSGYTIARIQNGAWKNFWLLLFLFMIQFYSPINSLSKISFETGLNLLLCSIYISSIFRSNSGGPNTFSQIMQKYRSGDKLD